VEMAMESIAKNANAPCHLAAEDLRDMVSP
jgi:hypothetical protein